MENKGVPREEHDHEVGSTPREERNVEFWARDNSNKIKFVIRVNEGREVYSICTHANSN